VLLIIIAVVAWLFGRKYIHDLRRNSEFLVLLRENAELRKEIAALRRKSNDLRWQNAALHNKLAHTTAN
jgi:uncharacterized membrane protein